MTFAMSTEGDSVKSALSEANGKNVTDNHTDSSQDSTDAKQVSPEKPIENSISTEKEIEKPVKEDTTEGESDQESEASEKKDEENAKKSEEKSEDDTEKKVENDTEPVKKEEKDTKSEEDEEDEEGEEEVTKKEEKESKEIKDSKEKEEKASTASEKDEEEDEEVEGEEDEEVSEEDTKDAKDTKNTKETKSKKKGVPLLDQPLETSGKRERKNVQRFQEEVPEKEPTKIEADSGSGTPLGEIPRVEASITRFKNDDLRLLYKILFKSVGKTTMLKRNIKKFNGFAFKKDSDEYKKRVESCSKLELKSLKSLCEMLDLQKTGTKTDIVERIMDFLLEPKDSGKPVGGGRPKRASAVRANNRGYSSHDDYSSDDKQSSRARRDKGKRPNLKDESSSDEEFKPGDASDGSDEKPRNKRKRGRAKKEDSEDEASLSPASSDDSDDVPKSKRRKSITKATPKAKPKTPARGRGRPSKGTPAPAATTTPRKSGRDRKPVRKHESSDEEDEKADEGSSSEDEPLAKKKGKSSEPPTDDEIKTYIKSILEGANLEEITMKTVCQRVYDNYPDFDLTTRKNFIKSTVRSLIST